MGVRIDVAYEGDLQCTLLHGPSGDRMRTDAPVDNQGRGEHFSPTDLVAAALGSCMLTTMGIAARARGVELGRCRATVEKEMGAVPRRHISRLTARVTLPAALDGRHREILEAAARACPVAASLGPDTQLDVRFDYA